MLETNTTNDKVGAVGAVAEMQPQAQDETGYYNMAKAWDQELYGSMKKSRLLAWIFAGCSLAIAAASVMAVVILTPLKQTQPYVIMVDKTNGYLQEIQKLDRDAVLSENEAVIQAELVRYVVARETFDSTDMRDRLNKVRLTSDAPIFNRYNVGLAEQVKKFNTSSKRKVNIKSVSMDAVGDSAFIRFSTDQIDNNQARTEHWIATIGYKFVDLKIPAAERFINPLGFIVVSYRVDPESI